MLEAIKNILLNSRRFQKSKKNCPQNKKGAANPAAKQVSLPINNFEINSIYKIHKNQNLNFTGYFIAQKPQNFNQTLEDNYFQLPQIQLYNGENYQLQGDESQIECAKCLYSGDSLIYCAPTGTGKTAVAHYLITKNLNENKKTIYTTPLKALADDKLREFSKIYGKDKVGLLTGDIKIRTTAPIQIMTTEIFNNQIPHLNPQNIGGVIFDEAHYLGSFERGNVWESSIVDSSKKNIQMLALSATIGNSFELGSWIQKINPSRAVQKVEISSDERFVPLIWQIYSPKKENETFPRIENYTFDINSLDPENVTKRQKRALEIIFKLQNKINGEVILDDKTYEKLAVDLLTKFVQETDENVFSIENLKKYLNKFYPEIKKEQIAEIAELLIDKSTKTINKIYPEQFQENYPDLIKDLQSQNLLPALIFKLSRNQAKQTIESLKEAKVDLTTKEEKEEIKKIINDYKKTYAFLGNNLDEQMLINGYAYHHAGMLPQYRKLVETLFSKKLIKVVSATSTLSAGINMPTKTVVLTDVAYKKLNSLTGEIETIPLSANDFHQMAGRAGRRGIDNLGHVILYNLKLPKNKKDAKNNIEANPRTDNPAKEKEIFGLDYAYKLLESPADNLKSAFSPEWVSYAQYFKENDSNENLEDLIDKSFKIHIAKNPDKEKEILMKNFLKYKSVLEKSGFIKAKNTAQFSQRQSREKIELTPKGEILTKSQCANPLLLAGLIYDEELKDIDIFDLCQIAGYIASSEIEKDNEEINTIINDRFNLLYPYPSDKSQSLEQFENIKRKIKTYEAKLIRNQNEAKISKGKILNTDSFGGFSTYIFAKMNDSDSNTISNFKGITGSIDNALNEQEIKKFGEISSLYNKKALEGNVYKIISQSISILNRIDKICDFALENPDKYPNSKYYSNLKETAQLAIILLKQNPIQDESAL